MTSPIEPSKGLDPVPACAATEDLGAPEVPGGEVDPSALALVLVLELRAARVGAAESEACFRRRARVLGFSSAEGTKSSGPGGAVLATYPGRDRGWEPPFPETTGPAGKSNFDNAKVDWHLG